MTFPVLSANGPSGYNLTRSLRFRSSASAYLNRTPATTTNQKTWTWSGWVKLGSLSSTPVLLCQYTDGVNQTQIQWRSGGGGGNDYQIRFYDLTASAFTSNVYWSPLFCDPSSWYHFVFVADTTQATDTNRLKLYVNGVQVTSTTSATWPAQNTNLRINLAAPHFINANGAGGTYEGYLAELNFVDGQALTPSSFGSTNAITGVWQPARYTGTYGTNGFYLPFTDNSALTTASNVGLGKDFSGNANYWVTNNISITAGATYDSMTDVPTLTSATAANFAVCNPLWKESTTTITNGNLNVTGGNQGGFSTMAMPTGSKFYCEATVTIVEGFQGVGIVKASAFSGSISSASLFGTSAYSYYAPSGNKYVLNTSSAYGSSWGAVNDVIGIAVDLSANTLTFYKNNVSQGAITIAGGIDYHFGVSNQGVDGAVAFNFGQQPFTYTPPSGFVALNTYNLPASTVPNGAAYMAATLYTGTGASLTVANTVGSVSFQPDFVWAKGRSGATDHALYDSVRGVQKQIESNNTDAETTETTGLTAFGNTGFTVGALAQMNTSSATYVAWQWKGGGTAVSNTNGSITSSVSANTTSGFGVATYTGTGVAGTIGHGLGVAPTMIIVKSRSAIGAWPFYHTFLGNGSNLVLNTSAATATSSTIWNATSPTSSVFSVGINTDSNTVTVTYVAYCFAAIKGFSAFGGYTGNGSTDGPFVYTGHRVRYLLIKRTDTTGNWFIYDTGRMPYNVMNQLLFTDSAGVEATNAVFNLDIVSNGFKLRETNAAINASAGTYMYAAFAENPFQNSLAR